MQIKCIFCLFFVFSHVRMHSLALHRAPFTPNKDWIEREHIDANTDDDRGLRARPVAACASVALCAPVVPPRRPSAHQAKPRRSGSSQCRAWQAESWPLSGRTCTSHPRGKPLAGRITPHRLTARSSSRARMFRKDSGPFLHWRPFLTNIAFSSTAVKPF